MAGEERYEHVDRSVLDEDVWATAGDPVPCPQCGFAAGPSDIRCPRCNALLIATCSGVCGACVSRTCAR